MIQDFILTLGGRGDIWHNGQLSIELGSTTKVCVGERVELILDVSFGDAKLKLVEMNSF